MWINYADGSERRRRERMIWTIQMTKNDKDNKVIR